MVLQQVEGRPREVCPACSWVNYEHWKVSAGACIEKDGRLLLVQRGYEPWKGCWHMPAGYVEVDESLQAAAERETLEETGLIVQAAALEGSFEDIEDPRGNALVVVYRTILQGGELRQSSESPQMGFFSPQEIELLPIAGSCGADIIQSWIKRGQHAD